VITEERLAEIEAAPRDASVFKAEAKELADAYRAVSAGVSITTNLDGVWLNIVSPSGKKAHIEMEAFGQSRGGIVGAAVLEWVDALQKKGANA
jgi:hypothetical protein